MRCLQWNWAHLKSVLVSSQNEAPFSQTSQATAVSPLNHLCCWACDIPTCTSPEWLFTSSGPPPPWVTNPVWDCLGLTLWLLLAPVVRNHLLISSLIFFPGWLVPFFCCVSIVFYLTYSFSLPRVYPPRYRGASSFLRVLLTKANQGVLVLCTKYSE